MVIRPKLRVCLETMMHLHASNAVWDLSSYELGFSVPNKKDL